jgi:hypothetical protein
VTFVKTVMAQRVAAVEASARPMRRAVNDWMVMACASSGSA